jgi:hypothetical protein
MATVTFVDETTSGDRGAAFGLEIAEERLTARELIRRRVFQEVAEFNARTQPQLFQGLVQPQDTERVLNGYALRVASTRRPRRSAPWPRSRGTASWCSSGTGRSRTRTRR